MNTPKVHQKVDFSGRNIFVGMDVHQKSWSITLYFEQSYLRTFSQPPSAGALETLLHRDYPGANYICGYEAGLFGFGIHRQLTSLGMECKVLHPADIPKSGKRKTIKTDPIDSRGIAEALSAGIVSSIYVPDPETEQDRSLVRYRRRIQQDISKCKNRIRGLLFQFGIDITDHYRKSWSKRYIQWLMGIDQIQGMARTSLNRMIEQLERLRGLLLEVNRDIRKMQRSERYSAKMDLVLSVVGIGPLTAISFLTEVGDIRRFPTFRKLNAFVGFYPMEYSSGENDYKGSITIRKNKFLRSLLIEAAWVAIRHDPALTLAYNEWKARMSPKRAIIKVARKLLSRMRYVLMTNTPYEKGLIK